MGGGWDSNFLSGRLGSLTPLVMNQLPSSSSARSEAHAQATSIWSFQKEP